jgi:uncharacterized protein (DUF2141 family)
MAAAGLLLLVAAGPGKAQDTPCPLRVEVRGLRSDAGVVRVALWRSADGFPEEDRKALDRQLTSIREASASVCFSGLAPGRYAISLIHDEDDDGVLDRSLLRIPREGVGISNDAIGPFGPHDYEEAIFALPPGGSVQKITLRYW